MLGIAATLVVLAGLALQEGIPATTDDGKKVKLLPDGRWVYVIRPVVEDSVRGNRTRELKLPNSDASLWIDPEKWSVQTTEGIRTVLAHKNGKLYGVFVSEGIGGISTQAVRDAALANWQRLDANAKILAEQRHVLHGKSTMRIEAEFTTRGVTFGSIGYYFGGTKSNLQALAFTVKTEVDAYRAEMTEFIEGLEIREPAAPEAVAPAVAKLSAGKFELTYDAKKWRASKDSDGVFSLQLLAGDAYARLIPEGIEIGVEALLDIALQNAGRESASPIELADKGEMTIGGTTFRTLRFDASPKGIALSFWGCYWGGKRGAVQLIAYTGKAIFPKFEDEFRQLFQGLKILE